MARELYRARASKLVTCLIFKHPDLAKVKKVTTFHVFILIYNNNIYIHKAGKELLDQHGCQGFFLTESVFKTFICGIQMLQGQKDACHQMHLLPSQCNLLLPQGIWHAFLLQTWLSHVK